MDKSELHIFSVAPARIVEVLIAIRQYVQVLTLTW